MDTVDTAAVQSVQHGIAKGRHNKVGMNTDRTYNVQCAVQRCVLYMNLLWVL